MDWEQLRERTLGEVGTALVSEGLGVTGGFLAAGFLGRQIQDRVKSDDAVTADPTATNKLMAWTANNVPKLALWYLLKKYTPEPGEELTPMKEATVDAKKAIAGSIVFDTLVRLSKGGINPAEISLFGYRLLSGGPSGSSPEMQKTQADIQRLIQENSALRAELNKALQRLATPVQPAPAPVAVAPAPAPVQVVSQPVVRAAPAPAPVQVISQPVISQPVRAAPAPIVNVTPQVQQAPPVVRYQPAQPPVVSYTAPQIPIAPVRRAEPVAVQPVPPAVSERERKYGFMQSDQTPPAVQERERKFGFMKAGEEKDIAAMFGML
jgi:hypothetical protein